MPTVWDESVIVSGEVAKFIVVARRAGPRWYLAALNGEEALELTVPLSFLKAGRWTLRAFADQPGGSDDPAVIESTRAVDGSSVVRLSLARGGGFAGIISETKTQRRATPRPAGRGVARFSATSGRELATDDGGYTGSTAAPLIQSWPMSSARGPK